MYITALNLRHETTIVWWDSRRPGERRLDQAAAHEAEREYDVVDYHAAWAPCVNASQEVVQTRAVDFKNHDQRPAVPSPIGQNS